MNFSVLRFSIEHTGIYICVFICKLVDEDLNSSEEEPEIWLFIQLMLLCLYFGCILRTWSCFYQLHSIDSITQLLSSSCPCCFVFTDTLG